MTNVVYLVSGLRKGGAETMLYNILRYQDNRDIKYKVISFGANHYYEDLITELNIEVVNTDLKHHPVKSLVSAYKNIHNNDVLCCWAYKCNYIGYYLGKLAHIPKTFWFIRHSNLEPSLNVKRLLIINRMCVNKSSKVTKVAYNGNLARSVHEGIGYDVSKSIVLDNGCDIEVYDYHKEARSIIEAEFGFSGKKIVLSVSNYRPIKDIPTFLKTFKAIHEKDNLTAAMMCGFDIDENNIELLSLIESLGLRVNEDVFLLGLRHDVQILMSACDIFILHSAGEAFSNTLLQAMACKSLVISTDVGDAKRTLGSEKYVVPVGDYLKIADLSLDLLGKPDDEKYLIRENNRQRVESYFNIKNVVKQYENLYFE